MPVADPSNGSLVCYYRAVGKLSYGNARPTHTTDCLELREAEELGAGHIESGVWTEFYIKVIYRRHHAVRS